MIHGMKCISSYIFFIGFLIVPNFACRKKLKGRCQSKKVLIKLDHIGVIFGESPRTTKLQVLWSKGRKIWYCAFKIYLMPFCFIYSYFSDIYALWSFCAWGTTFNILFLFIFVIELFFVVNFFASSFWQSPLLEYGSQIFYLCCFTYEHVYRSLVGVSAGNVVHLILKKITCGVKILKENLNSYEPHRWSLDRDGSTLLMIRETKWLVVPCWNWLGDPWDHLDGERRRKQSWYTFEPWIHCLHRLFFLTVISRGGTTPLNSFFSTVASSRKENFLGPLLVTGSSSEQAVKWLVCKLLISILHNWIPYIFWIFENWWVLSRNIGWAEICLLEIK